jgi:hypothetical protein
LGGIEGDQFMPFLDEIDVETGLISPEAAKTKGAELAEQYNSAQPFPHIMIDNFVPPALLEACISEFPSAKGEQSVEFDRGQERYKTQFHPDEMGPRARALFYSFNSRPFIRILENISGIKGLIPDPYFLGGGFHEIGQGGHLSVHADFNHHKPMNLERRINVLIYMNHDWKDEYGGQLELWDRDMKEKAVSLVPIFNRCVMFSTDSTSYHGNPQPINHPGGVTRKSIALYYYTSTWSDAKREHTTQFRVRAGTADKEDWRVRLRELAADCTPPVLARSLRKLKRSAA